MKIIAIVFSTAFAALLASCDQGIKHSEESTVQTTAAGGQENVADDVSQKDVVKVAVSSKDHTTLVAAIRQAGLVTSLSNAGPFTVFAPVNEAFEIARRHRGIFNEGG